MAGSLTGIARSVLADMKAEDRFDFEKLNEALRARFGTDNQAELFKIKLKNRVKLKSESLQELTHEIRQLVRLAYPNIVAEMHEEMNRDYFIEALTDSDIKWGVFQAKPKNVAEALKVALELDSFKESEKIKMSGNVRGVSMDLPERADTVERSSKVTETLSSGKVDKTLSVMLKKLESMEENQKLIQRDTAQKDNTSVSQVEKVAKSVESEVEVGKPEVGSNPGRGSNKVETCWKCGDSSHLKKDCPGSPKKLNGSDFLNAN